MADAALTLRYPQFVFSASSQSDIHVPPQRVVVTWVIIIGSHDLPNSTKVWNDGTMVGCDTRDNAYAALDMKWGDGSSGRICSRSTAIPLSR
jgi:hypothetical protein